MLITTFILTLLALSGADADCNCYDPNGSTVSGQKTSISNAYDSNTFAACFTSVCQFIADSGKPTVGWTNITVTFGNIKDPSGTIGIYDGTTGDPNKLITTISAKNATVNTAINRTLYSSTSSIFVQYGQNDVNNPNEYFGTITANSGLQVPTTTAIPVTVPTTTPFTSTVFAKNPKTISHDMLLLINQKTDQGMTGLNALNSLATQLVNLLGVTTDATGSSQTRLGLATLTPYTPNFAAQGEIWQMNATDVISALPKAGVTSSVDIKTALTSVLDAFFKVDDPIAPTRKSVQRSVVLFTAWWNTTDLSLVKDAFTKKGVNLAIIGFKTNVPTLLTPTDWYNYVSLSTTTESDVASFVNRFFLNSDFNNDLKNNWCKKGADQDANTPRYVIQEPWNYNGPNLTDPSSFNWGTTDGQTARYCNFQDTTYTYNRIDANKNVNVTLFYELEIENDFLKFWADGQEIESFTGLDVSSAYFVVNASIITARFTTDSAGVMRGFQATFEEV